MTDYAGLPVGTIVRTRGLILDVWVKRGDRKWMNLGGVVRTSDEMEGERDVYQPQ